MTQWDFQNKGKSGWTGASSFVLKVPLRHLRPSVIYSVPCDWILQRAYSDQCKYAIRRSLSRLGFRAPLGHAITSNSFQTFPQEVDACMCQDYLALQFFSNQSVYFLAFFQSRGVICCIQTVTRA